MHLYIKVDVNFPDHPKTAELSDRAFRKLVEAWCQAFRTGCDGALTDAQARRLLGARVLEELKKAGYVDTTADGYQLHNFTQRQTPAAVLQERHEKRVAAGRRGGLAKHASSKRLANAKQTPSTQPSKPLPEVEVEEETATDVAVTTTRARASASAPPPTVDPFDEFWMVYPQAGRRDKIRARKAFANAIKSAPPDRIIEGAKRYAADPNRDDEFTKHASSWLNAGSWDNGPLPPRNGRNSPTERARATLELGRRLSAAPDYPMELTS